MPALCNRSIWFLHSIEAILYRHLHSDRPYHNNSAPPHKIPPVSDNKQSGNPQVPGSSPCRHKSSLYLDVYKRQDVMRILNTQNNDFYLIIRREYQWHT